MTREAFIRKWLANPKKQYNEQCRDEMRDDLGLVIEAALRQPPVSERSEQVGCDNCANWKQGNDPDKYCLVCNRMVEP